MNAKQRDDAMRTYQQALLDHARACAAADDLTRERNALNEKIALAETRAGVLKVVVNDARKRFDAALLADD